MAKVSLVFFHGGQFVNKPEIEYINSKQAVVDGFDVDELSCFTLLELAQELGYKNITKMYYRVPGMTLTEGIRIIYNDSCTNDMSVHLLKWGTIEIYLEHGIDEPVLLGDDVAASIPLLPGPQVDRMDQNNVNESMGDGDVTGLNASQTVGVNEASVKDKDRSRGIEVETSGVGESGSKDVNEREIGGEEVNDDRSEHDNKDSESVDLVEVTWLSDSDDEELQNAREKIKQFRKKKKYIPHAHKGTERGEIPGGETEDHNGVDVGSKLDAKDSGWQSEYHDSSDIGSYGDLSSDSDEEDISRRRRKRRYPEYNPVAPPHFELGMKFENIVQFREAITAHSIANRVELHYDKNESRKIRAKCQDGCPWSIYASYCTQTNSLQVKTYYDEHTCNKSFKNMRCTAKFLAKHYRKRIEQQPNIKLKVLKDECKSDLKVDVTLSQCKRAKGIVLRDLVGRYQEEYSKLWDYAEELRQTNKGSTVILNTDKLTLDCKPVFKRFYVCFDACKKGWMAGCRPIIGLDGCFLKGPCKGELLSAVGRDGNNQMFPIAWAVVEVECKESWDWFLNLLMDDLGYTDGLGLTITSDQQKGLTYAIRDRLPHAEHRMCARHLYANWAKRHRGTEFRKLFWRIAKSTTVPDYEELMEKLRSKDGVGEAEPKPSQDLLRTSPRHWCKAFFRELPKCDIVDNNLSETFNGWILEARYKSIISMLEDIRVAIMNRIAQKRQLSNNWNGNFGPRISQQIAEVKDESCECYIEWNGSNGFEVKQGAHGYTVDLKNNSCSCRKWNLTGIPCAHAVCAIYHQKENLEDYIDSWYNKETYNKAYEYSLEPVKSAKFLPKTGLEPVEPPYVKVMPGRPKRNRRKDPLEPKKVGKLSRKWRIMTCQLCGGQGHNKKGCSKKKNTTNVQNNTSGNDGVGGSTQNNASGNDGVDGSTHARKQDKGKGKSKISEDREKGKGKVQEVKAKSKGKEQEVRSKGKETRNKEKSNGKQNQRKRKRMEGWGLYINPETGFSILNPGSKHSKVISIGATSGATSGGNDECRTQPTRTNSCLRSTQGSAT